MPTRYEEGAVAGPVNRANAAANGCDGEASAAPVDDYDGTCLPYARWIHAVIADDDAY